MNFIDLLDCTGIFDFVEPSSRKSGEWALSVVNPREKFKKRYEKDKKMMQNIASEIKLLKDIEEAIIREDAGELGSLVSKFKAEFSGEQAF